MGSVLSSVHIAGYRSFRRLTVEGLSLVNLFVGKNNAGKTSLLDAIELLTLGTPRALFRSPIRRGEDFLRSAEDERPPGRTEIDISHIFNGHSLTGASFSIIGRPGPASVVCRVVDAGADVAAGLQPRLPDLEPVGPALALSFESHLTSTPTRIPMGPGGAIPLDVRRHLAPTGLPENVPPANFLRPESSDPGRLLALWDSIALTPEEHRVVDAMRIIEPDIERIAFLGDERRYIRSVFLKLAGSEQRLPIGSVGDGLKRLLALSLHLIPAKNGFLFVDEIDTGLHFSVMADMWRMVVQTAKRLNIQVFATTHSLDCVNAFAWIRDDMSIDDSDVALHRIEKGINSTVRYAPEELAIAARHHLEVR